MKMRSLVVGLMMTACAFAASAEGDWRTTLGKVKDLSGDTGITAFFKREAPVYITGRRLLRRPSGSEFTLTVYSNAPSLRLLQDGVGAVGKTRIFPGREFYCYPSDKLRLTLVGRVGEDVCYYPVPLPGLRAGETWESVTTYAFFAE